MREVDRVAIEDIGFGLLQMMENAGRNLADLVTELFAAQSVTVLAGSGGNGGGGLVAARHLANHGTLVNVTTTRPPESMSEATRHQAETLEATGVVFSQDPMKADVIVDALLGYSLAGPPRGVAAELIEWANAAEVPIVSLDIPSGVDATSGERPGVAADAMMTLTLALPKTGLAAVTGSLYLADIGIPPSAYSSAGVTTRWHAVAPIVRLTRDSVS